MWKPRKSKIWPGSPLYTLELFLFPTVAMRIAQSKLFYLESVSINLGTWAEYNCLRFSLHPHPAKSQVIEHSMKSQNWMGSHSSASIKGQGPFSSSPMLAEGNERQILWAGPVLHIRALGSCKHRSSLIDIASTSRYFDFWAHLGGILEAKIDLNQFLPKMVWNEEKRK